MLALGLGIIAAIAAITAWFYQDEADTWRAMYRRLQESTIPTENLFVFRWEKQYLSDDEQQQILQWLLDHPEDTQWTINFDNRWHNNATVHCTNPQTALLFKLTFGGAQ